MNADILIVENDRKSIAYVGALAGYGYRIATAHTPQEANLSLAEDQPSAIIVDLKRVDVGAVLFDLRRHAGEHVQIIVIGSDAEEAYAGGADLFVPKPATITAVLEAVRAN